MSTKPIEQYAFLSDCNGSALVHRSGCIDWLCLPRFDSPALFARLLDEDGGHWSIRPRGSFETTRRYIDNSLALETTFSTAQARVVLTDTLAIGPNESAHGHQLGAHAPRTVLRKVECIDGSTEMKMEYVPRPEYGLIAPLLHRGETGIIARGGASVLHLCAPVRLDVGDFDARGTFTVSEGDELYFALRYATSSQSTPEHWSQSRCDNELQQTVDSWNHWSEMHQAYQGPWHDQVHHSARVLMGLTYYPTGAIVAAPTTSLPESPGGQRNWDYRYNWIRDASMTLDALWVGACPDEAYKYFDFLAAAALGQLQHDVPIQIMYGVGGEHDLSEHTVEHLSGWNGSAPVRVGNAAWQQHQLDVYGELLAAADRLRDQLEKSDAVTRRFLAEAADSAARHWHSRDHGIWEIRDEPRHYLYSKLMCWKAVDSAIGLCDLLDVSDRHATRWRKTRDEIRQSILHRGFSEKLNAYSRSYDEDVLDASALMMPIVGFVDADNPRMYSTIDAIEQDLTDHRGLVYRYRADDGLSGEEGTFLLCTFWLAHARALAGDIDRATEIFETALGHANDVGLFAEQIHPDDGTFLGNFPQAFSHIGLINAAWTISEQSQNE